MSYALSFCLWQPLHGLFPHLLQEYARKYPLLLQVFFKFYSRNQAYSGLMTIVLSTPKSSLTRSILQWYLYINTPCLLLIHYSFLFVAFLLSLEYILHSDWDLGLLCLLMDPKCLE